MTKKPQSTPLSLITPQLEEPAAPTAQRPQPEAKLTEKSPQAPTQTTAVELPSPTQTMTQESQPAFCNQSGEMVVLILGRSIHLGANEHRSDLVRLAKMDFDQQKALVYSLPAKLVVETPNMRNNYLTQNARLGDIFTIVVNKDGLSSESEYRATQAIAQAILDNFGVAADHYVTIKEDIVMQVVDSLGGIELELPQKFTMPPTSVYKGMVLQPGKYLFNGEMVHAYMTYLAGPADEWQRFSRQNVILDGMRQKIMEPSVFLKIPELFQIYRQNVVTDLSLGQIGSAACLAQQVSLQNITYASLPQEKVIIGTDGSARLLDAPSTIQQIQDLFGVP